MTLAINQYSGGIRLKLRKYVMLGTVAFTIGAILPFSEINANASTWHSSAIPSKLRGTWHAKQNYGYTLKITAHTLKYSGEHRDSHLKWRYSGHGFYRLKGNGDHYGDTILVHYFNHHKLSSNSFWHSYIR